MQYHYKIINVSMDEFGNRNYLEDKLNELSQKGWELVTAVNQQGIGSTPYNILGIMSKCDFIFKKPVGFRYQ